MRAFTLKKMVALAAAAGLCLTSAGIAAADTDETTADSSETDAEETTEEVATMEVNEDLTGSIRLAGSTSMEKLANSMAEAFMEYYPNVTVTAEFTGSSAGIEAVLAGQCEIGDSSRHLTDEEIEAGAVENIVAIDGIAVVVDPDNTVENLTTDDLISIYTGEITNWSELDGPDEPIVVIGREAGSGTRGAFEELLDIADKCAYASELDSTGAVIAKVASTPGAIGYASLDMVDDTVKALSIDDVEATEENIAAGDYTLARPFVMATNGEIADQDELVQTFFDFVQSDVGSQVIEDCGLILPSSDTEEETSEADTEAEEETAEETTEAAE
ncbi:MAG: phosphate ABC transporter substrate-binding protein [Lachnospiraceae bacterium]|jgi:phosphate transport system substrate-binding protein